MSILQFAYDPYKPGDVIEGNNKCTAEGLVCCAQGLLTTL